MSMTIQSHNILINIFPKNEELMTAYCREFNHNFNLWETKQIEKTHAKEKQSHAQDNIYVVRQFAYVHGVAGISL